MFNNSTNFAFPSLEFHYLPMANHQLLSLMNYQQISFTPFFCMDQNYNFQPYQTFFTYPDQPFIGSQVSLLENKLASAYQMTQYTDQNQNIPPKDQLHFYPTSGKYNTKLQKLATKSSGAFTYCTQNQENQRLNQQFIERDVQINEKGGDELNNEILTQDKKLIQNLRYQRKNIEANVVNKIYTYLKTILKFGQKSVQSLFNDREKSIAYFKVLEKLQKAKKQIIKRQFLKSLIHIEESLPGYSKIVKQLQKKGQTIQQFQYYIRVIIRNYLRNEASNSILTSKKMNSSLWIDHLRKVREISQYLFSNIQQENVN